MPLPFAIFFALIGTITWGLSAHAAEPTHGTSVYAFGRHLLGLGDHYRAITELKRFSLLFPEHPKHAAAQILLGLAYESSSDDATATEYYRRSQQTPDHVDVNRLALFKLGELRLRQRQYQQATRLFQRFLTQFPEGPLVDRTTYLLGVTHSLEGDVQAARQHFDQLARQSPWTPQAQTLQKELNTPKPRPSKSPRMAGILAGILPGAGHLYLGQPRHAITAFLLNGLFIAGATYSFLEGLNATGVILLYFETGWYLGNIKSAQIGAREFNQRQVQDLQDHIYSTYVPPGLTLKQLPGLGLQFQF